MKNVTKCGRIVMVSVIKIGKKTFFYTISTSTPQ
jgi:hypothetical protein